MIACSLHDVPHIVYLFTRGVSALGVEKHQQLKAEL